MNIHPKTSGAGLGGALGIVIVAILHSIGGLHLDPTADAAIPTFLSTLGAFLAPGSTPPTPVSSTPTLRPGVLLTSPTPAAAPEHDQP